MEELGDEGGVSWWVGEVGPSSLNFKAFVWLKSYKVSIPFL